MRAAIVLLDGTDELEVAGLAAAFGEARRDAPDVACELVGAEALLASARGMRLVPHTLGWGALAGADALVLPGGRDVPERASKDAALVAALRAHLAQGGASRVLASSSNGALALARAGLLEGRRVATAREHRDALAALGCDVDRSGKRVVRDGRVFTAAGPAAGVELGLALVAALVGERVAEAASDRLEVRAWSPAAGRDVL